MANMQAQPNRPLDEAQADKLFHAFKLARKHFPDTPVDELLAGLELCQKNGGLHVTSSGVLFAFLHYDPRQLLDEMNVFDLEELSKYDLRDGPVVHVVGFVAPRHGYVTFRTLIDALNPFGVSVHRINKRTKERFFIMKKNMRLHK